MNTIPRTKGYLANVVLFVGLVLAWPLWREFNEPDSALWNIFLAVFLLALVGGAYLGVRFLQKNRIEVGEARFDTRNR